LGPVVEQSSLSFAGLLRQLRTEAKLTQEELAEAAGLSPRSVSDLERGINRTARKDTALLLAVALKLPGPVSALFVAAARGKGPPADVLAAIRGGVVRPPGTVIASPYRGLSMFEEQDAGFFFGREAATIEVLDRMSHLIAGGGLLMVSGVSGAGKSSLLRAGVLPRLRVAGLASAPGSALWPCRVFTPTRAPLDELALQVAVLAGAEAGAVRRGLEIDPAGFALTARQAALTGPREAAGDAGGRRAEYGLRPRQHRVLLVVDQFEELFTHCADEGQRRAFITALHAAATTAHGPDQVPAAVVVLAVRADFEARCADYSQLAGAVQDRYLLTAMTERQLRMVITEPARKASSAIDDSLVELLLAEVRNGQPGAFGAGVLPLLSYALDQAWRSRNGDTVTLADYERTGGIERALAATAQGVYDRLTPGQQTAARQVFTRLAATSSEGMDTADRAARAELTEGKGTAEAQDVEAVLEAFTAERLLTLAAGTVELSHEVLLTAWPLLRDTWLAETRADRIVRTRLHQTAAEWARHSYDPSYLYRGSLLEAAAATAARIGTDPGRHPPLSQAERDFLHASRRAHRGRSRRWRALLAFLIALIIGLASVAVVAIRASQRAAHQRDILDGAVSDLVLIRSKNLRITNPTLSTLLSIAAWRIHPSNAARYAMLTAAAQLGTAVVFARHFVGPVYSVALSPDGTILASGGADNAVTLWNVATGARTRVLRGSCTYRPPPHLRRVSIPHCRSGPIDSVAFSPDGANLVEGSAGGTVWHWNLSTYRPIGLPVPGSALRIPPMALSLNDETRAIGRDGMVSLWDVPMGRRITVLQDHFGPVYSVAFSLDGKTLVSANAYGTVRVWNVAYLVDLVQHLCAIVRRSLTHAEWDHYVLPGIGYQAVCPRG
jgi:transcriptional regulator with XRE-family HTH domain